MKSEEDRVYDFYESYMSNNIYIFEYATKNYFLSNKIYYNKWKKLYYKTIGRKDKIKKIYESMDN